ncbi:polysaccharide deacetylase family protein [Actinomadura parmotrematis]|uniref:polysaccharide deacetylase family protein n=1 Tax=Actinomadura parmotrematis TaxID=2864039 RepID=UPI0027E2F56F|nr:polysaccharide deacetylase family protein [Actinomadura parmotrematis]
MRTSKTLRVLAAASSAASLAACGGAGDTASNAARAAHREPAPARATARPADPAEIGANELGLVPVLMYHRIIARPQTVYDRTPADLRAEFDRLAAGGYVPVTAADFATGRIDVPAGRHPVVLTFDDSVPSQLRFGADGAPAPDTAVGILLAAARRHPGFRPVATMYVNADPFGERGGRRSLGWLHAHGFEVGNHTTTHRDLGSATAAQVRQEIGGNQRAVQAAVPGLAVRTLALPFGIAPKQAALAARGEYKGTVYDNKGVFLVGANPAPSPYAASFDPLRIPRIRSQGRHGQDANLTSARWLDRLAAKGGGRYTSDGDPAVISYPRTTTTRIAPSWRARARPY